MTKSRFWRASPDGILFETDVPTARQNLRPTEFSRLAIGNGVLVGAPRPGSDLAEVSWIGVVDSKDSATWNVDIVWRGTDLVLKPTSAGMRYWRNQDWFSFAPDVAERYLLDAIFADIFDDIGWQKNRKRVALLPPIPKRVDDNDSAPNVSSPRLGGMKPAPPSPNPTSGFVYLIGSRHGHKIGKAVNVKSRTKLFEVKLPFPIWVEHYARFDDYTQAERTLHRHFHEKRLEGEWFNLNADDISFIKSLGDPQDVSSL